MDKILDKIGSAVGFVVVMIVLVLMAKNGFGRVFDSSNQGDGAARIAVIDQAPVDMVGLYEEPVVQESGELVYENIGIQEFIAMVRDGEGVEEENPARWELEYKDKYKGKLITWRGKVESIFTDQCRVVAAMENPDFQVCVEDYAAALLDYYNSNMPNYEYTYDDAYNAAYRHYINAGLDMITCNMNVFLTLEELASLTVGDEVLVQGSLDMYDVGSSSYFGIMCSGKLVENYGQ